MGFVTTPAVVRRICWNAAEGQMGAEQWWVVVHSSGSGQIAGFFLALSWGRLILLRQVYCGMDSLSAVYCTMGPRHINPILAGGNPY